MKCYTITSKFEYYDISLVHSYLLKNVLNKAVNIHSLPQLLSLVLRKSALFPIFLGNMDFYSSQLPARLINLSRLQKE